MNSHTLRSVTGALILAGSVLAAQAANTNKNRFAVSYRMGFNVSADFRNIPVNAFTVAGPALRDTYQDGGVGVDDTGNAANLTTRWGYQNASQVSPGNGFLVMHGNNNTLFKDVDDDPIHGFELTYIRELGRSEKIAWGFEAAFNWANPGFSQTGVAPGMAAYALGYTPPLAPYLGPVTSGPGIPLLSDIALPVSLDSKLDATIYGFRLGPYLDVPLGERITLTFGGGLAFACVEADFSYTESYGTAAVTASTSDSDLLVGGYISAQISWALSDRWNIFTGLQYQPLQSYTQRAGDKEVKLDFSGALFWTLGASFSF